MSSSVAELLPWQILCEVFLDTIFSMDVVIIFRDENGHGGWFQNTELADKSSCCTNSVCTSREAEEEELVACSVVICEEIVGFEDILNQANTQTT